MRSAGFDGAFLAWERLTRLRESPRAPLSNTPCRLWAILAIQCSPPPVRNFGLTAGFFLASPCKQARKPGVWFGMGGVLNAGVTLNWFRRNFAQELTYEQMSSLAAEIAPGSGGLVFFPAMMGERTPYLDAATRGMFLGATFAHTKAHFIRAIMEGVTFEMKSGIDILNGQYAQPEYIVAAGGAAKSPVWLQMQADIYAKTICVKQAEEQACMGAAIMAGIASGAYRDVREGCEAAVSKVLRFIEPIPKNADIYARLYDKVFRHQYDRNIELMRELAAFDG